MMLDDDQQGDDALDRIEGGRVWAGREKPGKDYERDGRDDGSHRDVAAEREGDGKDADGGQRGPWRSHQKDAEAGGHAFAAMKMQPAGEHVSENGEQSRERLRVAHGNGRHEPRAERSAQPDRGAAFEHVENKCDDAQAFAAETQHVGGADVAAAHRADVLAAEDAHQQVSRGDGPEKICGNRDDNVGEDHDESEFSR